MSALLLALCISLAGSVTYASTEAATPAPVQPDAASAAPVPQPRQDFHASTPSTQPTPPLMLPISGLYPLYDNTGFVLGHRQIALGYSFADFGVGNVVNVGVKPSSWMFRSPNIHTKVRVYAGHDLNVAVQGAVFGLLPGASHSFFSSQYTSRVDNRDRLILLAPLSVAASWQVASWLLLHNTTTAMGVFGERPIKNDVTFGNFVTAQLQALQRHAFLLHAADLAIGKNDLWVIGSSYRYTYDWFEFRLGYFYRINGDGMQGQALFDVGIVI